MHFVCLISLLIILPIQDLFILLFLKKIIPKAIVTNINFIVIVRIFILWVKIILTLLAVLNNAGCFRAAKNNIITFLAKRFKISKTYSDFAKVCTVCFTGRVRKIGDCIINKILKNEKLFNYFFDFNHIIWLLWAILKKIAV